MALTFDDGPDPGSTPRLLELLARHGAKATFFMVGARAARHPELVARVAAEGHEIGNHGWDHPSLPGLPPAAVADAARAHPDGAGAARPGADAPALRPPGPADPRASPGGSATARCSGASPARTGAATTPRPSPGTSSTARRRGRSCCCTTRSTPARTPASATGPPASPRSNAARAAGRLPLRHRLGAARPRRGAAALLGAAAGPRRHGAAADGGGAGRMTRSTPGDHSLVTRAQPGARPPRRRGGPPRHPNRLRAAAGFWQAAVSPLPEHEAARCPKPRRPPRPPARASARSSTLYVAAYNQERFVARRGRGRLRPDLAAAEDRPVRRRELGRDLRGDAGDGGGLRRAARAGAEPQPEKPRHPPGHVAGSWRSATARW